MRFTSAQILVWDSLDFSGQDLLWFAATVLALLSALVAGLSFVWSGTSAQSSPLTRIGDAAAGGIFLGVGFLHLLPEAIFSVQAAGEEPLLVFLLAGATVLFLKVLDSLGGKGSAQIQTLIVTLVLVTHMFLTGFALGAEQSTSILLVLLLALAVHKLAEAFAFGRLLARSALAPWIVVALLALFVVALPAGVFTAVASSATDGIASRTVPYMLAIGAGTFLHFGIGQSHLLASDGSSEGVIARAGGFLVVAALVFAGGHTHDYEHEAEQHLHTEYSRRPMQVTLA